MIKERETKAKLKKEKEEKEAKEKEEVCPASLPIIIKRSPDFISQAEAKEKKEVRHISELCHNAYLAFDLEGGKESCGGTKFG